MARRTDRKDTKAQRWIRPVSIVCFVLVIVLHLPSSFAQEATSDPKRSRLESVKQQLKEKLSGFQALLGREQNLVKELNTIDKQLQKQQEQMDEHKSSLATHQKKLRKLEADLVQLEKQHSHKKRSLAKRLRSIYKMGELSYLTPLLAMSTHTNVQQQIKYLQLISENDLQLIKGAQKDMQAILEQKAKVQKQKEALLQAQKELQGQQRQIAAQKQEKAQLLKQITLDKKQYEKLIEELENSAGELDSYLKKLEKQQEARVQQPGITGTPGETIVNPPDASKRTYAEHFRSNKGKLMWPVEGQIMTGFGKIKYGGTYTYYKGVDIKAGRGTPFYSVFKGTVKYAGWFKDYGKLVIVDHGGNFYTLYAHADQLAVNTGDDVETRQLLGNVGDTASIKGAHLYFEVRVNGKPDNPKTWLAKVK